MLTCNPYWRDWDFRHCLSNRHAAHSVSIFPVRWMGCAGVVFVADQMATVDGTYWADTAKNRPGPSCSDAWLNRTPVSNYSCPSGPVSTGSNRSRTCLRVADAWTLPTTMMCPIERREIAIGRRPVVRARWTVLWPADFRLPSESYLGPLAIRALRLCTWTRAGRTYFRRMWPPEWRHTNRWSVPFRRVRQNFSSMLPVLICVL